MKRLTTLVVAIGCLCSTLARSDAVTDWNLKSGEVVVDARIGTAPAVRVMAIVQTAARRAVVTALHRGASVYRTATEVAWLRTVHWLAGCHDSRRLPS